MRGGVIRGRKVGLEMLIECNFFQVWDLHVSVRLGLRVYLNDAAISIRFAIKAAAQAVHSTAWACRIVHDSYNSVVNVP